MTRYVTNDPNSAEGEPLRHVWESSGYLGAYPDVTGKWPSGTSVDSGFPAACGHNRRGYTVERITNIAESLHRFISLPETCPSCANLLVDRHGLPDSYRREEEVRL